MNENLFEINKSTDLYKTAYTEPHLFYKNALHSKIKPDD